MEITASHVKELREKTGLGMMLCKKALEETQGDMNKAIDNLRKQGQATMEKRAGKAAREGCVSIVSNDSAIAMFEVNSETDFVARNNDFVDFVNELKSLILAHTPESLDAALALASPAFDGRSVEAKIVELTGKIGERITFRRFIIETNDKPDERIFTYLHGRKIGVLVRLACEDASALDHDAVRALGKDIAMQIAASNPIAVNRTLIPGETIAKEKEIYLTQAQNSGKPEKVWEKIVEGKLSKLYKDVVLVEQDFIKNTEITVQQQIETAGKECGTGISVISFTRYELGAEE